MGHVKEGGLLHVAAAPVVEARIVKPRATAAAHSTAERTGSKRSAVAEAPGRRSQQRRAASATRAHGRGGLEAADAEEGEAGGGEREALGGGSSRISAPAKGSAMAARAWLPSM